MTKRSLFFLGACALAGATAIRRQANGVRARARRERERCEAILRGLDVRCADLR